MSCCNHDCRQGRNCPDDRALSESIFVGVLYFITAAVLVATVWAAAWIITHI